MHPASLLFNLHGLWRNNEGQFLMHNMVCRVCPSEKGVKEDAIVIKLEKKIIADKASRWSIFHDYRKR